MKQTRINPISKKQRKCKKTWAEIEAECIEEAHHRCKVCGQPPRDFRGLKGHHIIKKSQGGKDTKENCLITCGACHSITGHDLRESDPAKDARQSSEDQQGLIRRGGWGGIRRNRAEQCPTCRFVDIVGTCTLSVLPKRKCDFYREKEGK